MAGVKPKMRQAMALEKKISVELAKKFPDSLQKAFDQMDSQKRQRLDKEDLRKGVKDILQIKNVGEEELKAFLDRIQDETDGHLDFQQFLVRFGLDFKAQGRWEYQAERPPEKSKDPEEVKLFRRSMIASKWFGRGGIKAVLLRHTSLGSMHKKWGKLKQKCEELQLRAKAGAKTDTISLQKFKDVMMGSGGIEPNFNDMQWKIFAGQYLEKDEPDGYKTNTTAADEVLFVRLCDDLEKKDCTLAQLQLKEFGGALRDGLGMVSLSSDDVQLLSGKTSVKPWWRRELNTIDIDVFASEFVQKQFKNDLILFRVLLVQNVWPDIKRALDSLNTQSNAQKTVIRKDDFKAAFDRLEAMDVVKKEDREAILKKVEDDDLYEKEGAFQGQLDYMKNFLLHYIPNEKQLHDIVYPNWEDCAEKFQRFATSGDEPELNYRQFRELCRQFVFARDLRCGKRALPRPMRPPLALKSELLLTGMAAGGCSPGQLETLIDVMDEDGDGKVSLTEFKKRYARDEAKIMDAVRKNWSVIKKELEDQKKPHNQRGRLDRPVFQDVLLRQREKWQDVTPEQIASLVVGLDPIHIADKEVKWEGWLQKYAGDYFLVFQAFQPKASQPYKLMPWEVVVSCFEILESSRSIEESRMWKYLKEAPPKDKRKPVCPICESDQCIWHRDFKPGDLVTWEEFRRVLERASIDMDARLLTKLLDDLDPHMHGFIHWRAFVEGRIPTLVQNGDKRVWRLSTIAAGPYFLNGHSHYRLRQVLASDG